VATADAVKAVGRHKRQVNVSFDEWNVWYQRGLETADQPTKVAASWREHPRLIEDRYNVTDAVVVGTLLNSILRHGDRVKIANQAQLVNVIAPIRSEEGGPAWRQTIFWPFARMSEHARGQILRPAVRSDRVDTAKFGDADLVDASATWDEEHGRLAVFLGHRGLEDGAEVEVTLRGLTASRILQAEVLDIPEGRDRFTANTEEEQPVGLRPLDGVTADGGTVRLTLPPLSWAVVLVEVALG
jgi:alpha-L-arabinofuranosidase